MLGRPIVHALPHAKEPRPEVDYVTILYPHSTELLVQDKIQILSDAEALAQLMDLGLHGKVIVNVPQLAKVHSHEAVPVQIQNLNLEGKTALEKNHKKRIVA